MNPCAECGADLRPSAVGPNLCPACLLRLGLDDESDGQSHGEGVPTLLAPIGHGPNGIVYLGSDPGRPGALVTVKVINASIAVGAFLEAMKDTIARLQQARLPHLGRLLGAGTLADGRAFVSAMYAPGQALDCFLGADTTIRQGVSALAQLCSTVAHVHRIGMVHGAIKPKNVIVRIAKGQPFAVLLDTGIRPAMHRSRVAVEDPSFRPGSERDDADLHHLVCRELRRYGDTPRCQDVWGRLHSHRAGTAAELEAEMSAVETALDEDARRR